MDGQFLIHYKDYVEDLNIHELLDKLLINYYIFWIIFLL